MRFLYAIVTVASAFLPPPTMAAPQPTASSGCVANPKAINSLSGNFTIRVLAPDSRGKINLQASDPVLLDTAGLFSDLSITLPTVGLANVAGAVFSLKNKRLIAEGFPAAFVPPRYEFSFIGFRTIVFASDVGNDGLLNVTATSACDDFGKSFLRLGGDNGKNVFVVADNRVSQIYFRPDDIEFGLTVSLAIQPLK